MRGRLRRPEVAHAAIASSYTFNINPSHPYLVVCSVRDETELDAAFNRLKEQGVPCCAYYEPDFCGAMTAVATAPLEGKARQPLRKFRLASS